MIKTLVFVISTLVLSTQLYGQTDVDRNTRFLIIEPTFSFWNYKEYGLNFSKSKHGFLDEFPVCIKGPSIGASIIPEASNNLYTARVGYTYFGMLGGGRISGVYMTDFKTSNLFIRPEFGLSLGGWFSVTYGYNIKLHTNKELINTGHLITISLAVSSLFWK